MRLRRRTVVAAAVLSVVASIALAAPASAATTSQWANWGPLTGSSNNYTDTVTVAANPSLVADVTSDSRSGSVGVISGTSTWLAAATPVGAKYGSSQGRPYLNLRPRADNASSPSTTTYTFRTPTPDSGWTFVLGDIDADKVQISAVGPDGAPLTASQLGYRSSFNYCVPGVCTPTQTPADVPNWNPATATLSADPVNNPRSLDTNGAAAWFEPNAPIASLTFTYTRVTGFPVYQTWFASLARDITGTVSDANTGPLAGVPVTLTDHTGAVVGNTTTSASGSYAFPGYLATSGYTVSITPPTGKIATTAPSAPVDLSTADAVADFTVRDIIPVAVGGTVRDAHGQPVPGVVVTIGSATVTTAPDGTYLFDTVPAGTHQAVLTVPAGYTLTTAPPPFTIPVGTETPVAGQDFVITADPTISGTVRANGTGVAGVTVTAHGPNGPISTVTAADGSYHLRRVPAGAYTVDVTPPDGLVVEGNATVPVTVAADDVPTVDFALAKTGSIGGTVLDGNGNGVPGASMTIAGPSGSTTVTSDSSGEYGASDLPPGDYTITLTVPAGYSTSDPVTKTVTLTDAGETFAAENFTLTASTAPPSTPPPTTPDSAVTTGTGELAATGAPVDVAGGTGLAILLIAAGGTTIAVSTRRRRSQPQR